jgi:hypothetical protein
MHVHWLGRGTRLGVSVLWVAALLAICGSAAPARGATRPLPLGGTWTGTYSGTFSGTFTIHWREVRTRLTGSIALSRPKGTYTITGSVTGSRIHFGAVGAGATYTGSASRSSMSGSYRTAQGGGTWSATKVNVRAGP